MWLEQKKILGRYAVWDYLVVEGLDLCSMGLPYAFRTLVVWCLL